MPDTTFVCPVTGATAWRLIKSYDAPPTGETDFGLSPYHRELLQDPITGHVVNRHGIDLSGLYAGNYWDRTYGGGRMARVFDKIMALPPKLSDNRGRVAFLQAQCPCPVGGATLLDIGSGLAVFPAAMRDVGWRVTALDPDPRSARHAEEKAGVEGLVADFMTDRLERRFDLVTFNKVLEHVPDPVSMLRRAHDVLKPGGIVYVELPDGEAALAAEGPDREEFFIEHYCAFSASSFALLVRRAKFSLTLLQRLVEPSGKYTLRGVMTAESAQ